MKLERAPEIHVRLGFFKIFFNDEDLPIFAIFYREEKLRGHFTKYIFYEKSISTRFSTQNSVTQNDLVESYLDSQWHILEEFPEAPKFDRHSIFFQHLNFLRNEVTEELSQQVLRFVLDSHFSHTSYLCEDTNSFNLVNF